MAAKSKGGPKSTRTNKSHPDSPAYERTRKLIQTTQLVKRLTNHILGTEDDQGNPVKLDSSQVTGIKILLDKTLPNLSATDLTSEGKSINPTVNVDLSKK